MSRFLVVILTLLFTLGSPAAAGDSTGPSAAVARLNAALLDAMKNAAQLGYTGRYQRLAPVLSETFNFPVMARVSVGRHWSKLSAEQRDRLVDAFSRMSIATFAARFDGYSGEKMEVLGEEEGLRQSVLVRNQLVKADGEIIPLHYLMRKFEAGWRAVDVHLDAKFSEVATKRAEYTSVISREGFDALITSLERKIAELASGQSGDQG
ncbi:MAG: ABC transporter substrate-binding protein [Kiloniellales bacterium]|nr:ABC transporter substrate-binding protein [Kiloniellales bacterium]